MPKEIRRIVFSFPETTAAIRTHGKIYDITFPEGAIIRVAHAGDAEFQFHTMRDVKSPIHKTYNVQKKHSSLILTFFNQKTFEHKYFNLTADFVSAALIEFCIENKILLPKAAVKALDVTEFNVCLDLSLESDPLKLTPTLILEDEDPPASQT